MIFLYDSSIPYECYFFYNYNVSFNDDGVGWRGALCNPRSAHFNDFATVFDLTGSLLRLKILRWSKFIFFYRYISVRTFSFKFKLWLFIPYRSVVPNVGHRPSRGQLQICYSLIRFQFLSFFFLSNLVD